MSGLFSWLCTIPIKRPNESAASEKNDRMPWKIDIINSMPRIENITVLGPVPAIISRVKNQYRYRILLIAQRNQNIQLYIKQAMSSLDSKISDNIKIDIDPYNFY